MTAARIGIGLVFLVGVAVGGFLLVRPRGDEGEQAAPAPVAPAAPAESSRAVSEPAGGPLSEPTPQEVSEGGRVEIAVGSEGKAIDAENPAFKNTDFVCRASDQSDPPPGLVRLASARATFERCTFRCEGSAEQLPFAIEWTFPGEPDPLRLPTGKVVFRDCIFRGVAGAVRCDPKCTLVFEFDNVLHLSGPLVEARHFPAADAPLWLRLSHCTLRESGPAIRWRSLKRRDDRMPGSVNIEAKACVFALGSGTGLFQAVEGEFGAKTLDRFTCICQGCILAPGSPLFVPPSAEEDAAVARGLVRGTVDFAGLPSADAEDNAAVEWQAPLKTTDPPGIDPARLPAATD